MKRSDSGAAQTETQFMKNFVAPDLSSLDHKVTASCPMTFAENGWLCSRKIALGRIIS
jgi:hypothetical protein